MYRDKKGNLWTTRQEMVDIETGEMLTKYQVEKNYTKNKYTIRYENRKQKNGTEINIKWYTWECRRKQHQLRLF